jgi:drug/metabolite transporter (DMT)-like permease
MISPFSAGILFLLLSCISVSVLQILLRISQNKGRNIIATISANYFAASIVCYAALSAFGSETPSIFTLYWGIVMGIAFLTSLVLIVTSFRQRGVALTGAIAQLSVLIPTVGSVLIWTEGVSSVKAGGIILAVIALPLLATKKGGPTTLGRNPVLTALALFIVDGACLGSGKILLEAGYVHEQIIFNFIIFASACIVSIPLLIRSWTRPSRIDLGYGLMVGVLNAITSLSLITALTTMPGSTSFPLFSLVSSLLVVFMSFALLHEEIDRINGIGIVASIVAVVLLNI